MNSEFSFERLFGLIRKQWIENKKFYTLGSLALLGMMAMSIFLFWVLMDGDHWEEETAYKIYLVGLVICGSIYGSISFATLGNKEKGQYWLSFPASVTEKMIVTIFYSTIVFFLVYTGCFLLCKWGAELYIVSYVKTHEGSYLQEMKWEDNFGEAIKYIIWGYFCLQSLFVLGSVYFKQYAYIKTIIFVTLIGGMLTFLIAKIASGLFSQFNFYWNNLELREFHDPENYGVYKSYALGATLSKVLGYLLTYSWVPLFWVITWYRLKEKEI
jgi:hypothetical protein